MGVRFFCAKIFRFVLNPDADFLYSWRAWVTRFYLSGDIITLPQDYYYFLKRPMVSSSVMFSVTLVLVPLVLPIPYSGGTNTPIHKDTNYRYPFA